MSENLTDAQRADIVQRIRNAARCARDSASVYTERDLRWFRKPLKA